MCLTTFVSHKRLCDLESVHKDSLADVLEKFYYLLCKKMEVSTSDVCGYIAARSAIQCHLDNFGRGTSFHSEEFVCCNKVPDAYLKEKRFTGGMKQYSTRQVLAKKSGKG